MKLGIMQPYFFPYLGYWQLINAVDKFVLLDDVNFIMRGYINRNSILLNGEIYKFSIPLEKPSQNKLINETKLNFGDNCRKDFLETIKLAYKKAPYYRNFYPILAETVTKKEKDLTLFIKNSLEAVNAYLGIATDILLSSQLDKNPALRGQDRIISINKILNAKIYINAIGGLKLYDKESFSKQNIELKFLKMRDIKYQQFSNAFVPNLSIIDVMMFNSPDQINEMLGMYEIL